MQASSTTRPRSFLDLAVEIRLQIYELAFRDSKATIRHYGTGSSTVTASRDYHLLRTCKKIHQEASPVYDFFNLVTVDMHAGKIQQLTHASFPGRITRLEVDTPLSLSFDLDRFPNLRELSYVQSRLIDVYVPHGIDSRHPATIDTVAELVKESLKTDVLAISKTASFHKWVVPPLKACHRGFRLLYTGTIQVQISQNNSWDWVMNIAIQFDWDSMTTLRRTITDKDAAIIDLPLAQEEESPSLQDLRKILEQGGEGNASYPYVENFAVHSRSQSI